MQKPFTPTFTAHLSCNKQDAVIVKNATALISGRFQAECSLALKNGRIASIGCVPAGGEQVVDLHGDYLLPGFVDLHIHAFMGMDVMQGEAAIRHMSRELKKRGVAAFLPTTMSADPESTVFALKGIQAVMDDPEQDGAAVLGAHMEAPFLHPGKAGAQRASFFVPPTLGNWEKYTGGYGKTVKKLTLAPELKGAAEIIRYLVSQGIVVSAGHTEATAEELHAAQANGLSSVTHLFNASSPLHHRNPGVPGAALANEHIDCEIIADGVHLAPDIVRLICRCKGKEHTIAVTDAMEAAGMPDGVYQLGGQPVTVRRGEARLADGTLAGSTLTMAQAFTNLVHFGVAPEDASCMTSRTPAMSLGLADYGEIRTGASSILARYDREWNFVETVSDL